jgi:hypothetical protein
MVLNEMAHLVYMVEPMGFEFTDCKETKELCGAAWPSKLLKGNQRNS